MGRDLAESRVEVRDLYGRADDLLGFDFARLCWEGPAEDLTRTENAQPALLVHSYAVWSSLPDDVRASVSIAAGHSLGEFTAYLAAGVLTFEDALRLVRLRGELMGRAGEVRPGTMAAIIGLDLPVVQQVCDSVTAGTVVAANINAPGQIVVSGDIPAVEEACVAAERAGARRTIPLNVSGAFHSPLVEDAREGLAGALAEVDMKNPAFPVVANVTGGAVTSVAAARELLVAQLTSPVRWVECVETMLATRPRLWLELGPGKVLSGLLRRVDRSVEVRAIAGPSNLFDLSEEWTHA